MPQQARLVACMTQLLPQLPDSWLGVIEQAQQQQPEKGLLQYLTAVAYVQTSARWQGQTNVEAGGRKRCPAGFTS